MSDLNRLRELAALLRPLPVTEGRVKTRDDLDKKFKALEEGVNEAIEDLMFELGGGGKLETLMQDVGVADHKDARPIIKGIHDVTSKLKKEVGSLMMEAEGLLFSAMTEEVHPEPVNEMAAAGSYSSGVFNRKEAKSMIQAFKDGEETFELKNGDEYKAAGRTTGSQLKKGDIVFAVHDQHNTGAELYQIIGFGKDSTVKYDSVKAAYAGTGVKTLKALEAFNDKNPKDEVRLIVKDLNDGDQGDFFYVSQGRWSYGSGAEPLSFITVEKI